MRIVAFRIHSSEHGMDNVSRVWEELAGLSVTMQLLGLNFKQASFDRCGSAKSPQ
jgi:hypothetical protein